MMSSRAFLTALLGVRCAEIAASWSPEAGDFDNQGLSLLQLRFAKTSPSSTNAEAKYAGELAEAKAAILKSDIVEANDELQQLVESQAESQAEAREWAAALSVTDVEVQSAADQQEWALALGVAEVLARVHSKEDALASLLLAAPPLGHSLLARADDGALPSAIVAPSRAPPAERALPWAIATPKQEGLLAMTKASGAVLFPSGCRFTRPSTGVSPGSFNNLTHDVKHLQDCYEICDAEDSCFAVVFKESRSLCVTLPRKYDDNYKKRDRGPVVSNRICPTSSSLSSSLVGAGVKGCQFSTAIRGHSPGSMIKKHEEVATLEDCQKLCASDVTCLAVVLRQSQRWCFTLPRTYNANYDVSSDDAVASNKLCTN